MMGFGDGSGTSGTVCKQSAPRIRQITTSIPHHSVFIGQMLFLMPNQQYQSTEGYNTANSNSARSTRHTGGYGSCGDC